MKESNLITIREDLKLSRYKVSQVTQIHYDTLARIENPKTATLPRQHMRTLINFYRGYNVELKLLDFLG